MPAINVIIAVLRGINGLQPSPVSCNNSLCRSRTSSIDSVDTHDGRQTRGEKISLAQSALMCLDSLARHLGKCRDWPESLTEALQELTNMSAAMKDHINQQAQERPAVSEALSVRKRTKRSGSDLSAASAGSYANVSINHELKLVASLFLCCGTIVKAVGPRALQQLGPLLDHMVSFMAQQKESLDLVSKKLVVSAHGDSSGEENDYDDDQSESSASFKASVLLLRSVLASFVSIVSEIPSFAHPHLRRILSTSLSLRSALSLSDKELAWPRG